MKTFRTPNGKLISIFNEGFSVKVKFTTGGMLPPELSGIFTATDHAEIAILKYIDGLAKKNNKQPKE